MRSPTYDQRDKTPWVLSRLRNLALNGQEQGNIQVFNAPQEAGVEATFATHSDWGHQHAYPLLDWLGLRWTTLAFPYHFRQGGSLRGWLNNIRRLTSVSWVFETMMPRHRVAPLVPPNATKKAFVEARGRKHSLPRSPVLGPKAVLVMDARGAG